MLQTNPDFEKLKELHRKWSAEFDAIAFLELSRNERFHSRFLAWLLNPEENHGTRAYFLENFLWKTLEQAKALGIGKAASPETDEAIWTQTSVTPEWPHEVDGKRGFLDILLENQEEKVLCAIENKVDTGEHSDQPGRYRKALEKNYPDFTRHYVFLSPDGMPPEQEEDRRHWEKWSDQGVSGNPAFNVSPTCYRRHPESIPISILVRIFRIGACCTRNIVVLIVENIGYIF